VASSTSNSPFKRLARRLARPITSPIDGRVADINRRVGDTTHRIGVQGEILQGQIGRLDHALSTAIGSYARASTEATSYVGLELRQLAETVRDLGETSREIRSAWQEDYYRWRLDRAQHAPLEELDQELAGLLNHAAGHLGFAAQRELWFNPPLTVELVAGRARLARVNERIVEMPFAMAALGRLSPPARVLDIGSAESTFPLSAACLGYDVTALDLRPLPYEHPNLTTFAGRFEDWQPPAEPFAAAFLISTIEHVGLGAYGERAYGDSRPGSGADFALLERVSGLLAPDGMLVLTTPYGTGAVSDFERIYDQQSLATLLDGWQIRDQQTVAQRDDLVWVAGEEPGPGMSGVAMVVATRVE
jgi:hypothetical protein